MRFPVISSVPRVAAFALLLQASVAYSSIMLNYPAPANYRHLDQNGSTTVVLDPDPVYHPGELFFLTGVSDAFKAAMTDSKAATKTGSWIDQGYTFDYGAYLNGTFDVDVYKATLTGTNRGGADFLLRYQRGAGDPAANKLFWIQVVSTNQPNGGETIPYPDVYSGANADSGLPFFYTPAETKLDPNPHVGTADIYSSSYKIDGAGPLLPYDIAFWDFPKRNKYAYWRGELHLATYDSSDKTITVYDPGVQWGFDVVPEPCTYFLMGFGLLILFRFCRLKPTTVRNL